jgi:hypothetical protein
MYSAVRAALALARKNTESDIASIPNETAEYILNKSTDCELLYFSLWLWAVRRGGEIVKKMSLPLSLGD